MKKEEFKSKYGQIYDNPPPRMNKTAPSMQTVIGAISTGMKWIRDPKEALEMIQNCKTEAEVERALGQCRESAVDPHVILAAIKQCPRAYLLFTEYDLEPIYTKISAIHQNPRVFELMSEQDREDPRIIDAYREQNLKLGLSPCRDVDPQKYYSPKAVGLCYSKFLSDSCSAHLLRPNYPYVLKDASESIDKRFIDEAEKINPELSWEYDRQKKDVLVRQSYQVGYLATRGSTHFKDAHLFWIAEGQKHCPRETEVAIRDFREKHWDEISKQDLSEIANLSEREDPEFTKWLREELAQHQAKYHQDIEVQPMQDIKSERDEAEKHIGVNEFMEFLEQNQEAVELAIANGRISMQDIMDAIGQPYDVGVKQEQNTPELSNKENHHELDDDRER